VPAPAAVPVRRASVPTTHTPVRTATRRRPSSATAASCAVALARQALASAAMGRALAPAAARLEVRSSESAVRPAAPAHGCIAHSRAACRGSRGRVPPRRPDTGACSCCNEYARRSRNSRRSRTPAPAACRFRIGSQVAWQLNLSAERLAQNDVRGSGGIRTVKLYGFHPTPPWRPRNRHSPAFAATPPPRAASTTA
jgi:hypothetical protein